MKKYYKEKRFNALTQPVESNTLQLISEARIISSYTNTGKKEIREVKALWDTGATVSMISSTLATEMDLLALAKIRIHGVNSHETVDQYQAQVVIMNRVTRNVKLAPAGLHKRDPKGPPDSEIELLLGMDIISQGDFFVGSHEVNGSIDLVFSFQIPSCLEPLDFVKEINSFNKEYADQQKRLAYSKSKPKKKPRSQRKKN
jgi:hypothetical protein